MPVSWSASVPVIVIGTMEVQPAAATRSLTITCVPGGLAPIEGRHAGSQGAPSFLTVEQKAELADEVATGRFRTAAEVRRWVEDRWGVSYTEGGMYALLKRLRCAPKVPRPIHEKADHLAQARWKKGGSHKPSTRSA